MQLNYKILLPVCFLLVTACSNPLSVKPENSITFNNGITTEKDVEALIRAIDAHLRSAGGGAYFPFEGGNLHDEMVSFMLQAERLNRLTMAPTQLTTYLHYLTIQQANIPLAYLDQTNMSESRKSYYRGLCSYYKALAYWQLMRTWGDVVILKESIMLEPVAKSPWTQVADYAIEQAEQAAQLLPEFSAIRDADGNPARNKFKPSKGAANALLAHLAAWKAGCKFMAQPGERSYDEQTLWKKAADACTAIITSGEYELAPNPEQVCESVLVGDSRESIYEVAYRGFWEELKAVNVSGTIGTATVHNNPEYGFAGIKTQYIRWVADSVKKRFPPNDLRRNAWFYKLDSLSADKYKDLTGGYAYPNKYRRMKFITSGDEVGRMDGYDQNYIIWRLAEIYLLRAECRARLKEEDGAKDDLNIVRGRSQATLYHPSEGDLRYAIFQELSKEMLFEPNSYYKTAAIRNGYMRIEPGFKELGYDQLTDQDLIDGALFMAYQSNEMTRNPLLRQNTYWFNRFGR
jgi:hypothetical protein